MIRLDLTDEKGLLPAETAEWLRRCAEAAQLEERVSGDLAVSVMIVTDGEIRKANLAYREKDAATDVLSFPTVSYPAGLTAGACPARLRREYDDEMRAVFLGDILISMDHVRQQAKEYGHSEARECGFLFTHGLLHLMGYDHIEQEDQRKMRAMEERILGRIGLGRE